MTWETWAALALVVSILYALARNLADTDVVLLLEAQKTNPAVTTFGMFTLTPVGVPVALAGIGYILLFSSRLLPNRGRPVTNFDNPRQYSVEMVVEPEVPWTA